MPYVHQHSIRVNRRRVSASWWQERRIRRGTGFLPIPRYHQQDYHSCGFLAALAVTQFIRPEIEVREVLAQVCPNYWGIDTKPLLRALRRPGIDADYREKGLGWQRLLKAISEGHPVIVSVLPADWDYDHWTVIRGLREGSRRVFFTNMWGYDGLRASDCSMSWSDFNGMWNYGGDGIICALK